MQVKVQTAKRRVHSAQFKAQVLAQCREPGASVAAVAMANGVNANMVRNWLVGRGLMRAGIQPHGGVATPALPAMHFVPVELAANSCATPQLARGAAIAEAPTIHVALCRGDASMGVHWPAAQAQDCVAWLREMAATLLKG